jgi:hypothetical protein
MPLAALHVDCIDKVATEVTCSAGGRNPKGRGGKSVAAGASALLHPTTCQKAQRPWSSVALLHCRTAASSAQRRRGHLFQLQLQLQRQLQPHHQPQPQPAPAPAQPSFPLQLPLQSRLSRRRAGAIGFGHDSAAAATRQRQARPSVHNQRVASCLLMSRAAMAHTARHMSINAAAAAAAAAAPRLPHALSHLFFPTANDGGH